MFLFLARKFGRIGWKQAERTTQGSKIGRVWNRRTSCIVMYCGHTGFQEDREVTKVALTVGC